MATAVERPALRGRTLADLPRPRGFPLLGNAIEIRPKTIHLQLERWAKQYDSAYTFRLFNRHVVVISDRAAIETMLADTAAKQYGLRSLVHAVVQSDQFTSK